MKDKQSGVLCVDTPQGKAYNKRATTGRPRKPDHERYSTPARQLGRIPEAEWNEILEAVKSLGLSKTEWCRTVLLAAARKINRAHRGKAR